MPKRADEMTARQQELLAAFREWIEASQEGDDTMSAVQSALPTGRVTLDFVGATFAAFGLMTIARAIRTGHPNASREERAAVYDDWLTVVDHLGQHLDERHAEDEGRIDPKKAN